MPPTEPLLFAVRFHDRVDQLTVRQAHLQDHLEWLRRHRDQIRVAGSLRAEPQQPPVGALWIVRAHSAAAVKALLEADPFWQQGLRASYEILHWSKAFPDCEVPV